MGARVDALDAGAPAFEPRVDRVVGALGSGPAVLFICDPNNPTGRALGSERLRQLLASIPRDVTLVLDQSFAPFASESLSAPECIAAGSVVLVRSLTKLLGVPGVRLGYVIAQPAIVAALRALQDPWSVAAQAIAAATVTSWTLPADIRATVVSWRERLTTALADQGLRVLPSETNFLLVHAGSVTAALVAALAERRIAIRSCSSFGLSEHFRIAVRPPAEQDALLGALRAIGGERR
jgi:histidinol-phosphate/aromatic aminotransferase/cobyric acid decarboxylase-like protein